jgi:DNA-binding beta-propeller fold protein YncE
VNVAGTFTEKSLSELTVNRMPAFIRGNTFEALNVFLQPGTNIIMAVAVDNAENVMTNRITVFGPTDTNAYLVDPLQLEAEPAAGFAPLTVTLRAKAQVPGQLRRVVYDFDGDHVADRIEGDLHPITVTFREPGQRFPVVTLETTAGEFSSIAGYSWFSTPMRIDVQAPPVLVRTIEVAEPVDVKAATNGNLYVLSLNPAMLTQFDTNGKTVRSLKQLGPKPSGLEVDEAGNVYVALSGANQVWKFKPTGNTFEPDATFGSGGFIGSKDGAAGSGSNQFNAPFDVALTPSGRDVVVSDSGNNRLLRFTTDGVSRGWIGGPNTNWVKFSAPKGVVFDDFDHLYTIDSGNSRVALATMLFDPDGGNDVLEFAGSGGPGVALGEFNDPVNLCLGERGLCVADAGNNRIQVFDVNDRHRVQLTPQIASGKELNLKRPGAVAWLHSFLEELLCIADTGNGRILLVRFPIDSPEPVWELMKESMRKGDIERTTACFTSHSAPKYRQSFLSMGAAGMRAIADGFPTIKPVTIGRDKALYRFDQVIQGHPITFPIHFLRELGAWKIDEY